MKYDLIIHNGTVITMNGSSEIWNNGAVCIKNGKILRVLEKYKDRHIGESHEEIDAQGGVIMPGLVNADTHLPTALLKWFPNDFSSHGWMCQNRIIGSAYETDRLTVRTGATLACAEMLLSGTTTCCDAYFYEDEVTVALLKAGMRAMVAQPIVDYRISDLCDEKTSWAEALEFVRRWKKVSPLVQPYLYCRVGANSNEMLRKVKTAAEELDVPLKLEMGGFENGYPRQKDEITDALSHGFSVMNFYRGGAGWILTPREIQGTFSFEDDAPIGLGMGEWSEENGLDLFNLMGMADRNIEVDPMSIIGWGTIDAAKVMGMQEKIGSLEEGKAADVIVLDADGGDNIGKLVNCIVSSRAGKQVRHVIVNGRVLVSDGNLKTIDADALADSALKVKLQLEESDDVDHRALIC